MSIEFVKIHKVKIIVIGTALVAGLVGVLAGDTSIGEAIQGLVNAVLGTPVVP